MWDENTVACQQYSVVERENAVVEDDKYSSSVLREYCSREGDYTSAELWDQSSIGQHENTVVQQYDSVVRDENTVVQHDSTVAYHETHVVQYDHTVVQDDMTVAQHKTSVGEADNTVVRL